MSITLKDCKPCNCNKHSPVACDIVTGACKCEHNTQGHHCDTCLDGFYGDAYAGTREDCKPCPCPHQGEIFGNRSPDISASVIGLTGR